MKRRKSKKDKTGSLFAGLQESLFQKIASLVVIFVFILLIIVLTRAFLYQSDYFKLRIIETRSFAGESSVIPPINYDQLLNNYRGRNIFKINLGNVVKFFRDAYPDAKEIVANIVLPDKIVVNLRCRWPQAILRADKNYVIDDEGYVLSGLYGIPAERLITIEGINIKYADRVGRRITSRNLSIALDLLKQLRRARFLAKYGVAKIDAQDSKNLSFFLANGLEVKIGCDNVGERMKILEKTLRDPRLILDKINYIDVRFEDAVVGPK
ncbi:MAG: cell division protein FtsQ/DivIB [Candidatus Omnitrophota bacterium]